MRPKRGYGGRPEKRRSAAQQEWNAAVGFASQAWEHLTDEQRLIWSVAGSTKRMTGQRYFVQINAPRIRDGEPLLMTPPAPEPYTPRLVLKELIITNRHDRISLKLRLSGVPAGRYTVWGARPCNRGLSGAPKCPRLGPLPPPVNQLSEITSLYFLKHGPYIDEHRLPLPGKRIYIRLRQEFDAGPGIYQEVRAIVPAADDRGARGKKP
jgi:hypothetical protein